MKIAILGYGKMGKMIEKLALAEGHLIVLKITSDNPLDLTVDQLKKADVAIDFSQPNAAVNNLNTCFLAGIPVVSGTTGWLEHMEEAKANCQQQKL